MRQYLEKVSFFVLKLIPLATLFLVPLFFLPNTPDFFNFNKQFLISGLASITLIAFSLYSLTKNKLHFTFSTAFIAFIGLAAVYIASTSLGQNPQHYLFYTTATVVSLAIIALLVSSQRDSQMIIMGITGLITSVTLLSIVAILVNFGLVEKLIQTEWAKSKFFSPSGDPFSLITLSIPTLVGLVVLAFKAEKPLHKALYICLISIIGLGTTFSIKPLIPSATQAGLAQLPYLYGWSIATDILKLPKNAFLGTGPDTFSSTYTHFKPAIFNLDNNLWSVRFGSSSNELLTLFSTTGILGLIFYLLLTTFPFLSTLKQKHLLKDNLLLFIVSYITATLIFNLLLPSTLVATTATFILIALFVVKLKDHQNNPLRDINLQITTDSNPDSNKPHFNLLAWVFGLASVVLIGLYWNRAVNIYASNMFLFTASQNFKTNPVMAFNKQVDSVKTDPFNPYLRINLSRSYIMLATNILQSKEAKDEDKKKATEFAGQAVEHAKAATNLDPTNTSAWENLADIYNQLSAMGVKGAPDWTLAAYSQAIALNPSDPVLQIQLGSFYANIGDQEMAARLFDKAIQLKPNWNVGYYNMAQIYKARKEYTAALAYVKEALKYTDQKAEEYKKISEDAAAIEKLAPTPTPTPTPSK